MIWNSSEVVFVPVYVTDKVCICSVYVLIYCDLD